jgi:hypothetical protein
MYNPPTLAGAQGTPKISRIPKLANFCKLSTDQDSSCRHNATGTMCAVPCGLDRKRERNSVPYVNGLFSEESDGGCFLWDVEDREDDSEGNVWIPGGVVGGDSECGDKGMRKSVGGGTGEDILGERIERHWVDEGVVITRN